MAKVTLDNQTEPDTPTSGKSSIYVDSTSKTIKSKDDAGVVTDYAAGGGGVTDHLLLSNIGVKTHATLDTEVGLNNAKVTNVTTDLATTHNASTVVVTSSDGTDATINAATATTAGIMSEAIYDDHVLNNAKVSDINHVTIELPNVDNTSDADKPVSTAQAIANTTDRNRANHTGTQVASTISDFDTEVSNNTSVTVNSSKVTNATHTGEVTGSGVLTVDKTSITNKTTVTAVSGDFLLISDTGDTGNLKKVDALDFLGTAPVDSVNGQTGVVVLDADDISDAATTNKFATAAELTAITTNTTNNTGTVTVHNDVTSAGSGDIITGVERTKLTGIEPLAQVTKIPTGGLVGQVLEKVDGTDYNSQWATPASGVTDHLLLSNIGVKTHATLDTEVGANNAKVTNATHTGEVTGSGVLTVDKTSITNKTTVTPVSGDFVLISDTGDTGNLKKVDVSDFINVGDALPAAIAGVITLADNTTYTLIGATNIGTDRIVFGINSSLRGLNPQKDIITYTGTGNMLTSTVNGFSLDNIGISCANGTMIQATNIDYTINPSVSPMQGRNQRFSITRCNLVGGGNGLGSRLGFLEGYATCNFNGNLITNWDAGFELSNCLSFEGLNNKSVLWNDQASTMITLRSNNFSGQTGGVGSYIPTGINAFNFNGNILHPRTSGYAASIDAGSTTALGNISGNIFITTGITTGGIFNPASVGFNELPTYNIQANTGIPDNTPTIQASIDRLQSYVTTINTINVLEKLNFGNSIKTTANLLISSRLLVTNATGFLVDEIVTGGTSGFTGKVQSIDTVNNYIWIKYVVDGSGNAQYFTVGETITGGTSATATTYNGVDGTFKYYGAKEISVRFIATITLEKVGNGRDTFEIVPVKNGAALDDLSTVTYLEGARPRDGIAQAIIPFATDDILELHIRNLDATANCECQGLVFNISGR